MKIIDIHTKVSTDSLLKILNAKLNPVFQEQRQSPISFTTENVDDVIQISQPDLYEGFLFRIEIKGHELWITRSEHYTDDVNSLTLESILNSLFEELSGDMGLSLILEG